MKPLYVATYCILLLANAAPAVAQKSPYDPEKYIEWSEHKELSWDLFKGKPHANAHGDAGTAVKIKASPYRQKGKIHYHVYALFNKQKSWCKGQSEDLLAHEQLHFDIAELTARQVRQAVEQMQNKGVRDLDSFNKAINRILVNSNQFDRRYDKETLHGILKEEQKSWQENVEDELFALRKYKKDDRSLTGSTGAH